jgi:predicted protein tyrosine phosphatase
MALCTADDDALLVRADLKVWYHGNQVAFRDFGRREFVRIENFAAQNSAGSGPGRVKPTAVEVVDFAQLVLQTEKLFKDAFKRTSRYNSWVRDKEKVACARPLARYMLDQDESWIIY